MKNSETDNVTFFDVKIGQFPDRSVRQLLENPDNLEGLLGIVDESLPERLDCARSKQVNRSSIADNLQELESDIIYTVPLRSDEGPEKMSIYILIEHQSTVDTTMSSRILSYTIFINCSIITGC